MTLLLCYPVEADFTVYLAFQGRAGGCRGQLNHLRPSDEGRPQTSRLSLEKFVCRVEVALLEYFDLPGFVGLPDDQPFEEVGFAGICCHKGVLWV